MYNCHNNKDKHDPWMRHTKQFFPQYCNSKSYNRGDDESHCYHQPSSPAGGRGLHMSIPWPRSALREPSRWRTSSWCARLSSSPSRGSPWRPLRTRRTSPSQNPLRSRTLSADDAPPAITGVRRHESNRSVIPQTVTLLYKSLRMG